MRIAYLGPAASFTHAAALKRFGSEHQLVAASTIEEAFEFVLISDADCAVVPVENSTHGAVDVTLDNLINTELSIDGEILLPVEHALLSTAEDIHSIESLYAHPQAFAQCRLWLEQHLPHARRIEARSNSAGADAASDSPTAAAIASLAAAQHYRLNVLAEKIQDIKDNATRFLVIAKPHVVERLAEESIEPVLDWTTSLLLSADNRPGALFRLIKPFADLGVSMTRIESRPSRKAAWDYLFMVDIAGRETDASVAEALHQVRQEASLFRILGSYPKAFI